MVLGCSHRRGATNSQKSPSPSSIFFTLTASFSSACGPWSMSLTTSSSWNWTPSKPSFLYSAILDAKATSLRTGGPNGSEPVLMFHGPKVKRYVFIQVFPQVVPILVVMPLFEPRFGLSPPSPSRSINLFNVVFIAGCLVERFTISCESCEGTWSIASSLSIYERQARESHPCPRCGAYTLRCAA